MKSKIILKVEKCNCWHFKYYFLWKIKIKFSFKLSVVIYFFTFMLSKAVRSIDFILCHNILFIIYYNAFGLIIFEQTTYLLRLRIWFICKAFRFENIHAREIVQVLILGEIVTAVWMFVLYFMSKVVLIYTMFLRI